VPWELVGIFVQISNYKVIITKLLTRKKSPPHTHTQTDMQTEGDMERRTSMQGGVELAYSETSSHGNR